MFNSFLPPPKASMPQQYIAFVPAPTMASTFTKMQPPLALGHQTEKQLIKLRNNSMGQDLLY